MSTVQLLVQKEAYAGALSSLLAREGVYQVARVSAPDFERDGVIVADRQALERYPVLLQHSERLVLIAPNDPNLLALLWEHNVRSVVFESDPPSTAVLAILGANLGKARPLGRIIAIDSRAASPNAAQISPKRAM
jgi:hypothetical protein